MTDPAQSESSGRWFPRLDREERTALFTATSEGAVGGPDFVMMMVFSGALASLGLLQGSTAVVIGAMLVAPLMGPLLAAGLALVQGNPVLFLRAVIVIGTGIGIGLAESAFFGFTNPGFEPSMEIQARGKPDILDLAIGFASGMAAAYALGRPKVAATLAGVAIAAALVPPLAVVGIALTNGHPVIALNASVLLGSNLVAIILGASIVFRLLGVGQAWSGQDRPTWAGRVTMVLSLAAVLLAAPLVLRTIETQRAGAEQPLGFAVSTAVRETVEAFVDGHPGVQVITQARDGIEPEAGVTVLLASRTAQPEGFETELEGLVRKARGNRDYPVRIFLLKSVQ